jgi:hypothetical protein
MNEKGNNPSEADRLKAMGHDRLMADLQEKYTLPTVEQSNSYVSPLEHLKRKQQERDLRIEGLSLEHQTFSESDIEAARDLGSHLDTMVQEALSRLENLHIGSSRYIANGRKEIERITDFLDQQVWAYKFTTEPGAAHGEEMKSSLDDSIYYVASSGVSVRIKRAAIVDHTFREVVQPFMELILFRYPDQKDDVFEREPILGLTVRDYVTPAFTQAVQSDEQNDFTSLLQTHVKDGSVLAVSGPDDVWMHTGNRVNSIVQLKSK